MQPRQLSMLCSRDWSRRTEWLPSFFVVLHLKANTGSQESFSHSLAEPTGPPPGPALLSPASVVSFSWGPRAAICQLTWWPPKAEALLVPTREKDAVISTYCVLSRIRKDPSPQCNCQHLT